MMESQCRCRPHPDQLCSSCVVAIAFPGFTVLPDGHTYRVVQEQQHKYKADSIGHDDSAMMSAALAGPSASSAVRTAIAVLSETQGTQWAIVTWSALLAHVGQLVSAVHGTLKAAVVWRQLQAHTQDPVIAPSDSCK